jgi:hypothetical protein
MSKFNLTELHNENIKEGTSRGGTINDSWYNIANKADELDGENLGIDTYPIHVQRLGPSSDGKTYEEIAVRYGDGHRDYFTIYDYKFGEDPTDEDNYQNEYPFSLGLPTGNKGGKEYAAKLGFNVEGMNENINEGEGFTEVSTKEIRFHLDAYRQGTIDGDDLAQAIEEIVFGDVKAPFKEDSVPLQEQFKRFL